MLSRRGCAGRPARDRRHELLWTVSRRHDRGERRRSSRCRCRSPRPPSPPRPGTGRLPSRHARRQRHRAGGLHHAGGGGRAGTAAPRRGAADRGPPGTWPRAWGWADPRAALLLDFWRTEVADARFLLVFRRPWEVVDELYRHGGDVFRHHPSLALDVWLHYNRRVVEFAIRHPRITIVCEAEQAAAEPRRLCQAVRRQFAVPLCDPSGEAGGPRPGGDDHSGRAMLLQALCPEAIDLYRRLQDLAGAPTPLPASGTEAASAPELWRHLLADWQRSAVADRPSSSPPFQWWPALRRKAA